MVVFYPLERVRVELAQSRVKEKNCSGSTSRRKIGQLGSWKEDGHVTKSSGTAWNCSTSTDRHGTSLETSSSGVGIKSSAPYESSRNSLHSASSVKPTRIMFGADPAHLSRPKNVIDFLPSLQYETFKQCLLRLYEEKSLYRGASHTATTLMISNAIFFYALQLTKRRFANMQQNLRHRVNHHHNFRLLTYCLSKFGNSLLASTLAGCVNVLLTNPLWVASLRIMETSLTDTNELHRQNLWIVIYRIIQNEGILCLWNGTKTSLLLVCNPIIQHFIYEQLWVLRNRREQHCLKKGDGRSVSKHQAASLSLFEAFVFGAIAKTVATVVTYPLQLAQVLIRLQRKKRPPSPNTVCDRDDSNNLAECEMNYGGTFDCLCQQFSSGGITSLFQGMNAKLLQTVLTAALTFLTYEQTLIMVDRVFKRRKSI